MDELAQENQRLKQENQALREALAQMQQQLAAVQQQLADLQARLGQNSRNSHWPSSRDKPRSKAVTRSLRQKSERQAGGQTGHPGRTLEMSPTPQQVVVHRPETCPHCQAVFAAEQAAQASTKRQVFDLPPIELIVTEHRVETLVCSECGAWVSGEFPTAVSQPTQYGPGIQRLAVYLKTEQLVPYERSQQFLADVCGVHLSLGTLENFVRQAAQRLRPVVAQIKQALISSPVVHFDESGFYIEGQRHWLHSAGTPTLTHYAAHRRRGRVATEALGVLPQFYGTAVHDFLAVYLGYEHCQHGLCNAHHLRDLNGVLETMPQAWQWRFKVLLLGAKQAVAQASAAGLSALPPPKLAQIERLYARLVQAALQAEVPPAGGWPKGARGRVRKSKARNLAERFAQQQAAVLAFVYDFKVPFDNNLAERDLRMLKVQQKISGCFRSAQGADDFCTIRSYTSTLRKQGLSVWQALASVFTGECLLPRLTPV